MLLNVGRTLSAFAAEAAPTGVALLVAGQGLCDACVRHCHPSVTLHTFLGWMETLSFRLGAVWKNTNELQGP
jgi:hypothetical protein